MLHQKEQSLQELWMGMATTSIDEQILQLRSVIHEQQITINQLKDQLNIVLSSLGVCEPTEHSRAGVSSHVCITLKGPQNLLPPSKTLMKLSVRLLGSVSPESKGNRSRTKKLLISVVVTCCCVQGSTYEEAA
jgi:uncharacterized coiled-coil protein SlyX